MVFSYGWEPFFYIHGVPLDIGNNERYPYHKITIVMGGVC